MNTIDKCPTRKTQKKTKCRHCARSTKTTRGRGLCCTCHAQPEVREQYPAPGKGNRGIADRNGEQPLPAEPTGHPPGSEKKIEVMAQRASRGEQLHHPLDATFAESRARALNSLRWIGVVVED